MKRLLVLTLSAGEFERDFALSALQRQSFTDYDHVEFAGLNSQDANDKLYSTIEEKTGEYRWFLRLDSDMVFRDENALKRLVLKAESLEDCDHAVWHVLDFLSETRICGIHLFSNHVSWPGRGHPLLVDANPTIPGKRYFFRSNIESGVLHAPCPSMKHAFQFGAHRGSKCFCEPRDLIPTPMRLFQLSLLSAIWEMFVRSKDLTRGAAILGAEYSRCTRRVLSDYRNDLTLIRKFEEIQNMNYDDIYQIAAPFWQQRRIAHALMLRIQIGMQRISAHISGKSNSIKVFS